MVGIIFGVCVFHPVYLWQPIVSISLVSLTFGEDVIAALRKLCFWLFFYIVYCGFLPWSEKVCIFEAIFVISFLSVYEKMWLRAMFPLKSALFLLLLPITALLLHFQPNFKQITNRFRFRLFSGLLGAPSPHAQIYLRNIIISSCSGSPCHYGI